MPLAVAALIRVLIQAAVQTGLFIVIEKLLGPLIDAAKEAVATMFNMTPEEAQDSIANEVIDAFAMIGIIGIGIKTKLPTLAAEKLGFASKGYAKRMISGKLATGVAGSAAKIATATAAKVILTEAEATVAVNTMKAQSLGFAKYYAMALGTLGVIQLGMMNIGNWIDFGNWNSGAYQKSMQKFIAWITFGKLVPDEDYRKSKTASADVFTKIYNTYKLGGAVGINDPYKKQSVMFTRENLMDIVDQAGASLLLATGAASTKEVLVATLPMIIFDVSVNVDSLLGTSETIAQAIPTTVTAPTITKVFTGVVSQGVVGAGLSFTARPDDMIESLEELKAAAANNLAPFLAALPGKIVYEVKIVPAVVTKEGFTQRGKTQRIQTGTNKNGTPKYKTVTNKFATLVVYALTDKGTRAKLATIVLGPTDSARLTVAQDNITALEAALPALVTTTKIADVTNIAPPVVSAPTYTKYLKQKRETLAQVAQKFNTTIEALVAISESTQPNYYQDEMWINNMYYVNLPAGAKESAPAPAPGAVTAVSAPVVTAPRAGATATTLFEWYTAQGQVLPTVQARSIIYQEKGLGQASYYTGTAEQNTKLLTALKA